MSLSPLRVLITNVTLRTRTGTEFFVRDLAAGLRRAGHLPAVYAPETGSVADEIRAAGTLVVDGLDRLLEPPDIIHGHHALPAIQAVLRFPQALAVFVVHDRRQWMDSPPRHPRIRRYAAVDHYCLERLGEAGIPTAMTAVIPNAVDLERFHARGPLPPRPTRALVLSNYATEETVVAAAREACARAGITLDAAGTGVGRPCPHPEEVLAGYDLVFGKARCALEALAVGCAVVLCDVAGVGGLVTPGELDRMRRLNFGARTLVLPLAADVLAAQIERYEPAACLEVSRRIREEASLTSQVEQWVSLYRSVLDEPRPLVDPDADLRAALAFLDGALPHWKGWGDGLQELERLRAAVPLALAEASRLRWERDALAAERDALAAALRALEASTTIQVRDRLLRIPVLGPAGRGLARWAARSPGGARDGAASPPPFPSIVGVARSGTTLLRLMLDAHSQLAIPPETGWLAAVGSLPESGPEAREAMLACIRAAPQWADFHLDLDALAATLAAVEPFTRTDGVRAFYRLYASRFGKPRAGDKTPGYLLRMEAIARVLPEAHFIHLIRDGRDVTLSVRPLWFSPGGTLEEIADDWCRSVREGREQGARCNHYLEVRFEELVEDPGRVLKGICAFVGLGYEPRMTEYHRRARQRLEEQEEQRDAEGRFLISKQDRLANQRRVLAPPDRSRIQAWRRAMTAAERKAFAAVAGPLLRNLGYED